MLTSEEYVTQKNKEIGVKLWLNTSDKDPFDLVAMIGRE